MLAKEQTRLGQENVGKPMRTEKRANKEAKKQVCAEQAISAVLTQKDTGAFGCQTRMSAFPVNDAEAPLLIFR